MDYEIYKKKYENKIQNFKKEEEKLVSEITSFYLNKYETYHEALDAVNKDIYMLLPSVHEKVKKQIFRIALSKKVSTCQD